VSHIFLKNVNVVGIDATKRVNGLKNILLGRSKGSIIGSYVSILQNISLNIKSGMRIGILGKNGSGKTSLLRTIMGVYPQKNGTVDVKGTILPVLDLSAGIKMELSGRKNIKLLFLYTGRLKDYNIDIEAKIIEFSGISKDKIDMKMKNYSSGMCARLIFSAIIFQHGDIALMDEAFATGDAEFINKSYKYMEKKWNDVDIGITISHNVEEIRKLCDYCYIMENGKISNEGKTNEMIQSYNNTIHLL